MQHIYWPQIVKKNLKSGTVLRDKTGAASNYPQSSNAPSLKNSNEAGVRVLIGCRVVDEALWTKVTLKVAVGVLQIILSFPHRQKFNVFFSQENARSH